MAAGAVPAVGDLCRLSESEHMGAESVNKQEIISLSPHSLTAGRVGINHFCGAAAKYMLA